MAEGGKAIEQRLLVEEGDVERAGGVLADRQQQRAFSCAQMRLRVAEPSGALPARPRTIDSSAAVSALAKRRDLVRGQAKLAKIAREAGEVTDGPQPRDGERDDLG